jgi:hypothetical protein
MTGLNHSLTGSLISVFLPVSVAVPAAFVSHFVLDSLPHFGEIFEKRKRLSKTVWTIDITLSVVFNLFLLANNHWLILLCSLVAMSPDYAWVYRFTVQEKFGKMPPKPENKFNRFHVSIQKFERRWGLIIEVIWAVTAYILLRKYL